jgi:predicted permease
MVFGRLSDGESADVVERRFRESSGNDPAHARVAIVPLARMFGTPESRAIVVREENAFGLAAGLAALVLIGGCSTLAALVLVHYERRRQEFAVRVALGGARLHLVGQLGKELGVVIGVGTCGAILVAFFGLRVIPSLSLPGGVDLGRLDLSIDWRVAAAGFAGTLLTTVFAAWLPGARFSGGRLATAFLAGHSTTSSPSSQRMRQSFLAVQVCASIVVLVVAGLFVRTVMRAYWAGPGFDAERTVFVTVRVASPLGARDIESWRRLAANRTARLRGAFRSLPATIDVAEGIAPIGLDASRLLSRRVVDTDGGRREVFLGTIFGSPNLLSALGVPLLAGRGLVAGDAASVPKPAVLTASLAGMLWPGRNALGQVLSLSGRDGGQYLIVGIAQDIVYGSFNQRALGVIFSSAADFRIAMNSQFVIHTASPGAIRKQIERAVRDTMGDVHKTAVVTGAELLSRDLGRQRLGAWFFAGFGLTALLLGLGGAFGLIAYLAESRRRECGVRLALGATSRDLVWHGVRSALGPVCIGLAMGLACAAAVSRVLASSLAGLSTLDPGTYATVAVIVLVSAVLVALAAAWRLTRVTPIEALRTN